MWKQTLSFWLGFFPINLVFESCPHPPLMANRVLPFSTRLLRSWLTAPRRLPRPSA